jgi:hypothetical protein
MGESPSSTHSLSALTPEWKCQETVLGAGDGGTFSQLFIRVGANDGGLCFAVDDVEMFVLLEGGLPNGCGCPP